VNPFHVLVSSWLCLFSFSIFASDTLTIISPHRKSIQDELVPRFEKAYAAKYHTPIHVEWIDQGGAENDLRFIRARAERGPIGVDLFWGGGEISFEELQQEGLLVPYTLPEPLRQQIPETLNGRRLQNPAWIGSALSAFGIFYNKQILGLRKLAAPLIWQNLGEPAYFDQLSMTDPRRSSSFLMMDLIILEALGWQKGWETLTLMSANTKQFTQSSSDPIKAVVSGEVASAIAVDFYAMAKINLLGEKNLGFVLPAGQTLFNSDPVAILKGTPHQVQAERFIEYILSPEAQLVLLLKKGDPQGPTFAALERMAVNPEAYKLAGSRALVLNPFVTLTPNFTFDVTKNTRRKAIISDLLGILHIDMHKELKQAWKQLLAAKPNPTKEEITSLSTLPVTEAQLDALLKDWDNPLFRNKVLNEWTEFARKKYAGFEKNAS
jgi:ABC-type Fe3+ transport system substrate-binding protein